MSIPPLRDYQLQAIEELRDGIRNHHRAQILVLPTGAGKTTVAAQLISGAVANNNHVLFMAHRKELVMQAKNRLHQFGIRPGVIMSGWKHRSNMLVNVASQQTLIKRELPPAKLIVVDEAHHSMSNGFKNLLEQYPKAAIVGLTATPYRLDGRSLGDIYTNIVAPITLAELTAQGFLVPARYIGTQMDMSDVEVKRGEYNHKQLHEKFDKKEIYDGVIENYMTYAPRSRAIVFNNDVLHSKSMTERFLSAGIPAAHLDADTHPLERSKILERYAAGQILVLNNVDLFGEGFDLPEIETVIANRRTKSKSLWKQWVGRGLRPAPGKTKCTVIDQGGNVWEHGPVDAPEEYSLEPEEKKKKSSLAQASPVKMCGGCGFIQSLSAQKCSECGHVFTTHITERELPKAEFLDVTDEVKDFVPRDFQKEKKHPPLPDHLRKAYTDMTEEELKEVAEIRGYKPGWVWVQLKRRKEMAA